MFVVGIDENGLGPALGPLVATAVTLRISHEYDAKRYDDLKKKLSLGDSKKNSAFGHMSTSESLALALVNAPSADALFESLLLRTPTSIRKTCPSEASAQCWGEHPLPAFGGNRAIGHAALSSLREAGVEVVRVRSDIACVRELNEADRSGKSKVVYDLELFARLLIDARKHVDEDFVAHCGMVGGIRNYAPRLQSLGNVHACEESKGVRAYRVDAMGEVRFEVKADDRHLAVGLASMVGKYVRELTMKSINDFYRGHDLSLRKVSGYHDPVTRKWIADVADLRRHLRVADDCFLRSC